MDIERIDARIEEIRKEADQKIQNLEKAKQRICPHKHITRAGFFQSTTAHEWDECDDCGAEFNHISFPA
jgi:hypothetical protein